MWDNTCGIASGKTKDGIIQAAQSQGSTPDLMLKEETKENVPKTLVVYYPAGGWDLEKLFFFFILVCFLPSNLARINFYNQNKVMKNMLLLFSH